jgi:hypothetical protein
MLQALGVRVDGVAAFQPDVVAGELNGPFAAHVGLADPDVEDHLARLVEELDALRALGVEAEGLVLVGSGAAGDLLGLLEALESLQEVVRALIHRGRVELVR